MYPVDTLCQDRMRGVDQNVYRPIICMCSRPFRHGGQAR